MAQEKSLFHRISDHPVYSVVHGLCVASMVLMAAASSPTFLGMAGTFFNHIVSGFQAAPAALAGLKTAATGLAHSFSAAAAPAVKTVAAAIPAAPVIPAGCHLMPGNQLMCTPMGPT